MYRQSEKSFISQDFSFIPSKPLISLIDLTWEYYCSDFISIPRQRKGYHGIMVSLSHFDEVDFWIDGVHQSSWGERGSIGIFPSGTLLGIESSTTAELLMIWLNPQLLDGIAMELNLKHPIQLVPYNFGDTTDSLILEIGVALLDKLKQNDSTDFLHREVVGKLLSLHLLTYYSNQEVDIAEDHSTVENNVVSEAIAFIDENFSLDINQEDIAKHLNVSKFYFARKFKESLGVSPHQYIIGKRIRKAQFLLRNSNQPISDIALECGFTNQSHLNLQFKKILGVTPGKYRQEV